MIKSPVALMIFAMLVCFIAMGVMQANVQQKRAAMLESFSSGGSSYLDNSTPIDPLSQEGQAHLKALLGEVSIQTIAVQDRPAPRQNLSTSPVVEFFYPSRLYSIEDTQ